MIHWVSNPDFVPPEGSNGSNYLVVGGERPYARDYYVDGRFVGSGYEGATAAMVSIYQRLTDIRCWLVCVHISIDRVTISSLIAGDRSRSCRIETLEAKE